MIRGLVGKEVMKEGQRKGKEKMKLLEYHIREGWGPPSGLERRGPTKRCRRGM